MERLHPIDKDRVIREIIPGGQEPRRLLLYPDDMSVRVAQRLEQSRLVPGFFAALLDEGEPVSSSFLEAEIASRATLIGEEL